MMMMTRTLPQSGCRRAGRKRDDSETKKRAKGHRPRRVLLSFRSRESLLVLLDDDLVSVLEDEEEHPGEHTSVLRVRRREASHQRRGRRC